MRLLASVAACTLLAAAAPDLTTEYERSGGTRTGRYSETIRVCDGLAATYPKLARCLRFGTTLEQRPLVALVVSGDGTFEPKATQAKGRPVVLAIGGIHAGEIDGKDAGFTLLKRLLRDRDPVLRGATLVFVPVFNVDGHERFGRWNRPNQVGPEEMGWRTNARNLNLNRDWMKADAAEMRALLGLVRAWDPVLTADLHVTDGAEFQHDVAIIALPVGAGPAALTEQTRAMRDAVLARLTAQGHAPVPFYPTFRVDDDPTSGFSAGVPPPRLSHGYFWLRNRMGVLVETHAWKPYAERVRATEHAVEAMWRLAADGGPAWRRAVDEADREALKLPGTSLPLAFEAVGPARTIDFLGYAWTKTPSPISGVPEIRYDRTKPETWRVPLLETLRPTATQRVPEAYVVPPAYAELIAERLAVHGIAFTKVTTPATVDGELFRATEVKFSPGPSEGRQTATVKGGWAPDRVTLAPGSLRVPVAQPLGRVVVALFEPEAPDSFAAWGFFNAHFERKEYMESYVVDTIANELMANDPATKREFERLLRDDPAFATSPERRREFFYRRSPSWDALLNVVPIRRIPAR